MEASEASSSVCLIEVDADGAVGTGFLGVFPALLPGLFLITCSHVLPNQAACAGAVCSFEAHQSIALDPCLGFWAQPDADVAVVRVQSGAGSLPPPQVLDLDAPSPRPGEVLSLSGYCRQELRHFSATLVKIAGAQFRAEVQGRLPEFGASGGPVMTHGRTVALHMGVYRGAGEACGILLSALDRDALRALRSTTLPKQVMMTGRRGTNDIINGVYQVDGQEVNQTVWALATGKGRSLLLYKGLRSQAWTIGSRLGDGLLRSEGGSGGILARRDKDDAEDPTEAFGGIWHVASGAEGQLQPDRWLRLKSVSEESFAQLMSSWRLLAEDAAAKVAAAEKEARRALCWIRSSSGHAGLAFSSSFDVTSSLGNFNARVQVTAADCQVEVTGFPGSL
ncbi:unnamed protein product [Effrenium voratum]|uniref:Uncharacterized protein n=1 Tax=Effrenium voratum TaxID=2562239 RepID=A0AA36J448_9DINO|nr:unnamed protein product [Effrenium voratum]